GLEISFESKQLREICENEAEGNRQLGETVAKALRSRLADMEVALSPKELLAGRPAERTDGMMCVDLEEGSCMVFVPNHPVTPLTIAGNVDWSRVHSIR